jgi:hypothetical protein
MELDWHPLSMSYVRMLRSALAVFDPHPAGSDSHGWLMLARTPDVLLNLD